MERWRSRRRGNWVGRLHRIHRGVYLVGHRRLWGLPATRPGTLHVDRAVRDGIPVTSLARTVLDVAAAARPRTVRRYIQRADDAGRFDLRAMHELLERIAGHRGRAKVLAALDI